MRGTHSGAVILVFAMTASVYAGTVDGTVMNKTTGKPSAGDRVVLVDLGAGMAETATAITDLAGKYSLQSSGAGTYLIRVDHQGASYFIAAPQAGSPANITVYDVAAKLEEVRIDADMLLIEAGEGTLHVRERYLVRNASSPPRTQFSRNTFEIVLPEGAQLEEAAATCPGGMGTRTHLVPIAQKGHYSFNVPIQPDLGEKETMFEVAYHFTYNGRRTVTVHPVSPADHFVVYTAKGIEFTAKDDSRFKLAQEDARVETHVAMNARPEEEITFIISGEGKMPPDASTAEMRLGNSNASAASAGESIRASTGSPDPLAGSKGWLLGGAATVCFVVILFVLHRRGQAATVGVESASHASALSRHSDPVPVPVARSQSREESGELLDAVKEELFALEQDKVSGRVSPEEYAQTRAGLQAVLRRQLNSKSH